MCGHYQESPVEGSLGFLVLDLWPVDLLGTKESQGHGEPIQTQPATPL